MPLIDSFQRQINYLRLSVTDHCNYRCFYCRSEDEMHNSRRLDVLRFEEIVRVVKIFASLGISKVRLTGGEPLLRKNIIELISALGEIDGIKDLPLSTNAHLLTQHAVALKQAGVNRVNISLDSLNKARFKEITRGGDLNQVLAGIDQALAAGLTPVKINMVVMADYNDGEIESMLDFCFDKNIEARFIETMPIGMPGVEIMAKHYPKEKILARIKKHSNSELIGKKNSKTAGPASQFEIANTGQSFAVISAVSDHFCASCNRVRLSAKGDFILCLGQEDSLSLKSLIRQGYSDKTIREHILRAIVVKPEKHNFNEDIHHIDTRHMVAMGG